MLTISHAELEPQMDDDKKVMICTRVSPETRKILKIIAAEQDTSTQQLVREALRIIFKNNGKTLPDDLPDE